jgi:hypothetical protein
MRQCIKMFEPAQGAEMKPPVRAIALSLALALSSLSMAPVSSTAATASGSAPPSASAADTAQWQTVSSKSNKFSALMPGTVTKAQQQSERHTATTYYSSVTDGKQTSYYMIVCTKYGAEYTKKRTRERLMRETAHRQVTDHLGKLLKRKYHKVDGYEVLDYEFEGYSHSHKHVQSDKARDLTARGRIIWPEDIEYSLLYATTRRAAGGDCDRFFNSFKVAAPD